MRLLLDAHALLWWLGDDPALAPEARSAMADTASVVFVSAATIWEIAIKESLGRLEVRADLEHEVESNRFEPLPITLSHGNAAGRLPNHHRDPFDRMLVAQAQAEGLTIVTRDPRIAMYGVPTLSA